MDLDNCPNGYQELYIEVELKNLRRLKNNLWGIYNDGSPVDDKIAYLENKLKELKKKSQKT